MVAQLLGTFRSTQQVSHEAPTDRQCTGTVRLVGGGSGQAHDAKDDQDDRNDFLHEVKCLLLARPAGSTQLGLAEIQVAHLRNAPVGDARQNQAQGPEDQVGRHRRGLHGSQGMASHRPGGIVLGYTPGGITP